MQTEHDKKDNKRDRQALEEDKSVDSGSTLPKRQKSETEPTVKDANDHPAPLLFIEGNEEEKDDKKRSRSALECNDSIDNGQPSSKRRKPEQQTTENDVSVIPEQSLSTGGIAQRKNLLELFLKQDDYFLYFPKKTAYKFTVLSKSLMEKYIDLANKYKEIDREEKKLTFELDIMSNLKSFNEKAKRACIDREEVCLILKTPQLDHKKYDNNCKKIVVPTSCIYISPKWKNVIIKYDFLQLWQTDITGIEIDGREINSLKLQPLEWTNEMNSMALYAFRSIVFRFKPFININCLEKDQRQKYITHSSFEIPEYCITNKFNAYKYRSTLENYKDKVISITSAMGRVENVGWNIREPLNSFINLKHLSLQDSSSLVENDKFPLSLKSVEFGHYSAYRHVMNLYNDGVVLDNIVIPYLEYEHAEEFMIQCTTKSLIVNIGFTFDDDDEDELPDDFKITLPKTLEQCSFCVDGRVDNNDRITLETPFLDCSLTDLKSMKAELKMLLKLPHKCVDMTLFLIDDVGEFAHHEFFEGYVPKSEVIAAWTWPLNMERLEIHSSKIFNYNPDVPESLKCVTITEMDMIPNFPLTLSNIALKTTVTKTNVIDFKLFPDIFTSIDIQVNDAGIFGNIGHLNNLRKIFVFISNTIEDRIVFKCPPGLQSLHIRVDKDSFAEIQILPNEVLGRVVYGNIEVIIDRELYKGIFLKE